MDSGQLDQLALEVIRGVPAERSELPDGAETRAARAELERDVAALRARGIAPDLVFEWPET